MWDSVAAILSSGPVTVTIDSDTFPTAPTHATFGVVYDLYDILGSPADPAAVIISLSNAANLGSLYISNSFHPDSTFAINFVNDARIVGRGGTGGTAATSFGGVVYSGGQGDAGRNALISAFDFNLNLDAGYILGGGGGGGGGGANLSSTGGVGGGGGGIGYNNAAGGASALPSFSGGAGSNSAPGAGGVTSDANKGDGGAGGSWGATGGTGVTPSSGSGARAGGAGGVAIIGDPGAIVVTRTGAKSTATLTSENRLEGGLSNVTMS